MNWIFEHLNIVFIVGGAIAWWLNQRRKRSDEDAPAPHQETTFDDPDLAERTRRIREEIQRKIDERARGYTQPAPPAPAQEYAEPPPLMQERPAYVPAPAPVAVPSAPSRYASRQEAARQTEILEQQASLAERLRMAEEMKQLAQKRAAFETAVQAGDLTKAQRTKNRAAVLDDLHNPEAMRRAFVLREVLGPPVALK